MDLELVNFINSDLTWNAVKKGRRSMLRRRSRYGASSSKFGSGSGNKAHDSIDFDYEKSGVAILGQHFAQEALDVPIKKRILLLQTPGRRAQSPPSQTSYPLLEETELTMGSKHASGAIKSNEEGPVLNDFSGIELLAAAACHSSGHLESPEVEAHTTPGVDSYNDGAKHDTSPMDSDNSSVQNLYDNGNCEGDKRDVLSKFVRLHWDLNTVMFEWEEPCDILVDPHSEKSYVKDVYNNDLENAKANLEGYETRKVQVTEDVAMSVVPLTNSLGKTYDAESCVSKSDVVDSFVHTAKCENISTSTASVSLEPTTIKVDSDTTQAVSEVVQDERLSDCCGSNVSQDERGHIAERNTTNNIKSGYDSPVEDGELRELTQYPWEKNEVEERECVDYESDNMYEDNFDTIESVKDEIPLNHHQTVGLLSAVQNNVIEKDDKASASNRLNHQEHSQSVILEEKNASSAKFLPERESVHDKFPDRSTSFGVRRNGDCIRLSRSDNIGDAYSRAERDFGSQKFMGRDGPSYHDRAPNDVSGQWVDSTGAWDSRNSRGYPRSKNDQSINYIPRGNYRTFNTRPLLSDRKESYGGTIHRGTPPARGISRDRCRVGSGFHPQGLRRASQEEHNDPEPYSERKVSCFSSNYNQGAHVSRSRRRSRSRSRSGSPITWHFQKKRNVDTIKQSPERFPFRKPGEIEASRSFDDRNVIKEQYRDKRSSPVRVFNRNQRFDPPGYLPRMKSNDHFRPTSRPARFNSNDSMIHDDKYGMMNERRRFRHAVDESFKARYPRDNDNGLRYTRNENRCFKDPASEEKGCRYTTNKIFNPGEGDFHKDNLRRD